MIIWIAMGRQRSLGRYAALQPPFSVADLTWHDVSWTLATCRIACWLWSFVFKGFLWLLSVTETQAERSFFVVLLWSWSELWRIPCRSRSELLHVFVRFLSKLWHFFVQFWSKVWHVLVWSSSKLLACLSLILVLFLASLCLILVWNVACRCLILVLN